MRSVRLVPVISLALGIALALALGALHITRADLKAVEAQYDGFKQTVKANGEKAEAEAKLKESQNDQQIDDAITVRDDALAKLRAATQANPAGRRLSGSPTAPAGSSQICIDASAYNAAFSRYRERLGGSMEGIRRLVIEGDEAAIDAKALIQAWPK